LKKLFAESESLPWSGNNNQVYRSLVELHRTGMTDQEVQQPAEGPARKLYTLTPAGRVALRDWLTSELELPAFRSPIFARLIGSDLLTDDELDALLSRYDEELRLKLAGLEELQRRGRRTEMGSERQRLIWQRIHDRPASRQAADRIAASQRDARTTESRPGAQYPDSHGRAGCRFAPAGPSCAKAGHLPPEREDYA
jgi:DNA-binding PadR family transcriptional regulator